MSTCSERITLKQINQQNLAFWETNTTLMNKRLENDVIREMGLQTISSTREVNLPIKLRMPLEVALEIADNNFEKIKATVKEDIKVEVKKDFALIGGRAIKEDPLQKYILALVQTRPDITSPQLLKVLVNEVGCGLIEEVDQDDEGLIYFKNGKGKRNDAEISGLKDRLSRAKKKINSH